MQSNTSGSLAPLTLALAPVALCVAIAGGSASALAGGDPVAAQAHGSSAGPSEGGVAAVLAGSGGPAGTFDWCVPPGQTFVFNTDVQVIFGGPHCSNTTQVTVQGGVLDVRNLRVGDGAVLRVIGANPMVVRATGAVVIDGTIDLSGTSSPGVVTLNTTNIPEVGAPGQGGGGRGGVGSPFVSAASPRGGNGAGAFDIPGRGGAGGETGWNNVALSQVNGRRGAGGGGGVFGADQAQLFGPVAVYGDWEQAYIGLDAEPGFDNTEPAANGALSGTAGPLGGAPGTSPFLDADPDNDFYGLARDLATGQLVVGELRQPWAGAGGGAGGDASFVGTGGTWPPPFAPTGDEKGAGGAGGGGALHVMALGDIRFGPSGLIRSRGGSGGGGENTIFLNRIGGASGGGSGGHVILETAGRIDLSQVAGPSSTPGLLAGGIIATGGEGGAGRNDVGGAYLGGGGKLELPPHLDACPPTLAGGSYPSSGLNACLGHVDGAGGDGGPGLIQLHTRNHLDPNHPGILLPPGLTLEDVCKPAPVGYREGLHLLPRFVLP